jgi:hypothetical protein
MQRNAECDQFVVNVSCNQLVFPAGSAVRIILGAGAGQD